MIHLSTTLCNWKPPGVFGRKTKLSHMLTRLQIFLPRGLVLQRWAKMILSGLSWEKCGGTGGCVGGGWGWGERQKEMRRERDERAKWSEGERGEVVGGLRAVWMERELKKWRKQVVGGGKIRRWDPQGEPKGKAEKTIQAEGLESYLTPWRVRDWKEALGTICESGKGSKKVESFQVLTICLTVGGDASPGHWGTWKGCHGVQWLTWS